MNERDERDTDLEGLWEPAKELGSICRDVWGVPDCEACATADAGNCDLINIFGIEKIREGNPDVQVCSNYVPREEKIANAR